MAKLWANLSGFLWWLTFPRQSISVLYTENWECLPCRKERWNVASPFLSLPREEHWLMDIPEGTGWLLQILLRVKPCLDDAHQARFVLETCFSRVVWLTYSLFPTLGTFLLWLYALLKAVDKTCTLPSRAWPAHWSTHTKYYLLKFTVCKWVLDKRTSWKYQE